MYTPPTYPCYVFYFDGFYVPVETPEDLQPVASGFRSPCASLPEMAQGWQWKIWPDEGMHGGPFAPDKTKYRYKCGLPLERSCIQRSRGLWMGCNAIPLKYGAGEP